MRLWIVICDVDYFDIKSRKWHGMSENETMHFSKWGTTGAAEERHRKIIRKKMKIFPLHKSQTLLHVYRLVFPSSSSSRVCVSLSSNTPHHKENREENACSCISVRYFFSSVTIWKCFEIDTKKCAKKQKETHKNNFWYQEENWRREKYFCQIFIRSVEFEREKNFNHGSIKNSNQLCEIENCDQRTVVKWLSRQWQFKEWIVDQRNSQECKCMHIWQLCNDFFIVRMCRYLRRGARDKSHIVYLHNYTVAQKKKCWLTRVISETLKVIVNTFPATLLYF